jgi:hypothetical protein
MRGARQGRPSRRLWRRTSRPRWRRGARLYRSSADHRHPAVRAPPPPSERVIDFDTGLTGLENPCSSSHSLRLLLDPSPPFVRTGTFTFPTLPEIHISAAPFKRHGKGSLNAMKIPGLTPYVLSCIQRVAKVRPLWLCCCPAALKRLCSLSELCHARGVEHGS